MFWAHRWLNEAVEIWIDICVDGSQANLKLLLDHVLDLEVDLGARHWDFWSSLNSLRQVSHWSSHKMQVRDRPIWCALASLWNHSVSRILDGTISQHLRHDLTFPKQIFWERSSIWSLYKFILQASLDCFLCILILVLGLIEWESNAIEL